MTSSKAAYVSHDDIDDECCLTKPVRLGGNLELSFLSPTHTHNIAFARHVSSDTGFQIVDYDYTVYAIPLRVDNNRDALIAMLHLENFEVKIL